MHQISVGTDVAHCQVIPLDGSKNALSSLCSLEQDTGSDDSMGSSIALRPRERARDLRQHFGNAEGLLQKIEILGHDLAAQRAFRIA